MRSLLALLVCATSLFAVGNARSDYSMKNTRYVFEDSLRIDSTETKWMPVWWQDNGAQTYLLLEARDDSSAGFASDSFSVKIEAYQIMPLGRSPGEYNSYPYFVALPSKAHPDSSTSLLSGGADFVLYDSLDILDMDSACVYARNLVPYTNSAGDTIGFTYGDSLATLQTSGFGAFEYVSVPFDFTPSMALKITGLARNKKGGVGSFLRVRVGQLEGEVMKGK